MVRIVNKSIGASRSWEWIKNSPPDGGLSAIAVVPEQCSHEAERELAKFGGDGVSLYAEVLTFSRLATRVFAECGGLSIPIPDKAAKLLTMRKAMKTVSDKLSIYRSQSSQPEFLSKLIALREELNSACVDVNALEQIGVNKGGNLGGKLCDLWSIFTLYDSLLSARYVDSRDRIARMAELIGDSSIGRGQQIRFEGYSDFTKQEFEVISALIRKDADITFVLYCAGEKEESEFDRLTERTRERIHEICTSLGKEVAEESVVEEEQTQYALLELDSVTAECEFAAEQIERWLSEGEELGDIAVAAPEFSERYEAVIRSVFANYGIPMYLNDKEDILSKPIMTLVTGVYAILGGGWRLDSVMKFAKTGLCGISREECDELENYCLLWNIRGERKWQQEWKMNPSGYVKEWKDSETEALSRINEYRVKLVEPLMRLKTQGNAAKNAAEQAIVLYDYLESIGLAECLEKKNSELIEIGEEKTANEYSQLWEFLISTLERINEALQDDDAGFDEFGRLLTLLLGQYKLSTIPPALHRVRIGGLEWIRESSVRRLIILGVTDSSFPKVEESVSLISDFERNTLKAEGIELQNSAESKLERELYISGRTLAKADYVTVAKGERLSYLTDRERKVEPPPPIEYGDAEEIEPSDFAKSKLSPESVKALYGEKPVLTASKVGKFAECNMAHWISYGLDAKPRKQAGIDAPEFGTLMHYVLEKVSIEVKKLGGFSEVSQSVIKGLAGEYCDKYADERLRGGEKRIRFEHLFRRLREEVVLMVAYIAKDLAKSRFEPEEFEHRLQTDFAGVKLSGIIDRVDALKLGEKVYVRVADYKTGSKNFSLSDVYYGLGMQMLMYLFAYTDARPNIEAAGVYYTPAKDILMSFPRNPSDEDIERERSKRLKWSGIMLEGLNESDGDKIASYERIGKLGTHVRKTVKDIEKAILSGESSANPIVSNGVSPCDYCEYISICGGGDARELVKLKDDEVWECLEER